MLHNSHNSLWRTSVTERTLKRFPGVLQQSALLWRGSFGGLKFKNRLLFLHRHLRGLKWKFWRKKERNFRLSGMEYFEKVSHTKLIQFVQNQNIVKLASCFRPKLEILKYSWAVSLIILVDIECIDYSRFFDCQLSRFLNKSDRESRFFNIVCRSQGDSSTTKAKHYSESLRISKQISNTLTGFTLQFLLKLFSESWHRSQSTNFL